MIPDKLKIEMKLRDAQYDSLLQLDDILQRRTVTFKKDYSGSELASLYSMIFRRAGNFDYDFPSFCFALATGVGKTRLLGACIYILNKVKAYRNFFVITPNKTVYQKFLREIDERHEKYIFEGITDLPKFRVYSGEDFSSVKSAQPVASAQDFTIYIFNIDKFKSQEKVLEVKKIDEYLGESFYDYVRNLGDLVILMDESHKYKTSIAVTAINGLKPLLGLEFTATPFKRITENEKSGKFENILYEYSLGAALAADSPVLKRPQLLLRRNFNYESLPRTELHDVLISDALDNHEKIKARLETHFANENIESKKRFLPLVLVVCQDISHAMQVERYLKEHFLEGKYRDKIARIHSTPQDNKDLSKEEKYDEDAEVEKLLDLEKATNTYEIVINVNKLGLGWDVKNIYTIVPLRAFDSQVFVEQSIGRGLRLPFGKWVSDAELNKLRIAYHSNFGKVIRRAGNWLANIEVIEPSRPPRERHVLRAQNKNKAIQIPQVELKLQVDFSLAPFSPRVTEQLENVEVSLYVKDLATREETDIGAIKEELAESPKEYILRKLLELPRLSARELPILATVVDIYLDSLGKQGQSINTENRLRIVSDIYDQIKEKIAEATTITYQAKEEQRVGYVDYDVTFETGFVNRDYEEWDDNETGRGLVTGYKKCIFAENVFDSRQERIVAKVLEKDREVLKWFRPYRKENFSIPYLYEGDRHDYIPDFVAEVADGYYIIEPKSRSELNDDLTKAKARAASQWIDQTNKVSKRGWTYLLISHDRITSSVNTLRKLAGQRINLATYL